MKKKGKTKVEDLTTEPPSPRPPPTATVGKNLRLSKHVTSQATTNNDSINATDRSTENRLLDPEAYDQHCQQCNSNIQNKVVLPLCLWLCVMRLAPV